MLILEGAQAVLSWLMVLKKRDNYRQAFDGFDAQKMARYSQARVEKLLRNPGIIRNRLKVNAAVVNAQAYLEVLDQSPSIADFIWQFVDGKPIINHWSSVKQLPITTAQSDIMSKMLKQRAFKFIGSIICYAYMQAVGMVNDHTRQCFKYPDKT